MIKRIALGIIVASLATACVSKKVFVDLEDKYNKLKEEKIRIVTAER